MADLTLKDSEQKYLEFTRKDDNGNYIDLSGCSVTLQVQKYGESSLAISSPCEVISPSDGKVRYLYEGELTPGHYRAELEVYDGSNILYITKTFTIKVEGEIK